MPPRLAVPKTKTATGPSQDLIARIQHLGDLLRHLPTALADYPSHTQYNFVLDPDRLTDGGYFSAVGHALEISFQTHLLRVQNRPLLFIERGQRHDELVKLLKTGVKHMSPGERTSFQEAWIERLITAAVASGAKIPSKKRKAPTDATEIAVRPVKRVVIDVDATNMPPDVPSSSTLPLSPASPAPIRTASSSSNSVASSSRSVIVGNPKQQSLNSFGWQKATPESTSLYWAKVKEDGAERREQLLAAKQKKIENQRERERDLARLRKQRQRERDKAKRDAEEPAGRDANTVLMEGASAVAHTTDIPDVAALSRSNTQGWKKNRNGTLGGVVRGSSKKVFWFTPFLWAIIEPTVRRCGWSAARTVKELHRSHPNLFDGPNHKLHRATVWKWIVSGEKRFTDAALRSISARSSLGGSGKMGVLTRHPEIVEETCTVLKGLRVSGCVINVHIARSLMIAIIKKHSPALLASFSCSEKFVRTFLDSKLNWSSRKATRAAKHIPDNAGELCERTFFRLAHTVEHQDIPAKLIINYDQTGVYIRPSASQTFEVRGSKQVSVSGNDEKRAYSLGVASAADGTLLPLEQIWSGRTTASLPTDTADGYQDALDRGFLFSFAASKKRTSHFATEKTMKDLVTHVFKPYIDSVIESDPDLDADQKSIIYIDIYPVHTSESFRAWMSENFPDIIIIYVPGNCTALLQPQDVGIQRVAKLHLRQSQLDYLVRCHQQQLADGITPENVKFSSSYPVLRNASVRACVELYDWLTSPDGRKIIKRSWELCSVPGKSEYNLSYECLTSRSTRKALRKYLEHDTILADEIKARLGPVSLPTVPVDADVTGKEDSDEPDVEEDADDELEDDTDVPVAAVVERVLRIRVRNAAGRYVAKCATQAPGEDRLSAADVEEDIWAYNDNGDLWTEAGIPAGEDSESEPENSGDDYDPVDDA